MGILKAVYNRVRPLTPRKIGVVDGYPIRWPRLLDQTDTFPQLEYEQRALLNQAIREGDHVVILGGGFGVTMCVAADCVGAEGSVSVFEASPDVCPVLEETARLNGVSERVRIHALAVTDTTHKLYGKEPTGVLHPAKLPECDVLEIDIDGAELDVLDGMDIQPREIVVECHKDYGVFPCHIRHRFKRDGYELVEKRIKHDDPRVYNVWASLKNTPSEP